MALWQRLPQGLNLRRGDAGVPQIQLLQPGQGKYLGNILQRGAGQIQPGGGDGIFGSLYGNGLLL